jgi:hypothetical protein
VATGEEAAAFRSRHGIGAAPLVLVLPGSRRGEVTRLAPVFGATVGEIVRARAPEVEAAPVTGLRNPDEPGFAARPRLADLRPGQVCEAAVIQGGAYCSGILVDIGAQWDGLLPVAGPDVAATWRKLKEAYPLRGGTVSVRVARIEAAPLARFPLVLEPVGVSPEVAACLCVCVCVCVCVLVFLCPRPASSPGCCSHPHPPHSPSLPNTQNTHTQKHKNKIHSLPAAEFKHAYDLRGAPSDPALLDALTAGAWSGGREYDVLNLPAGVHGVGNAVANEKDRLGYEVRATYPPGAGGAGASAAAATDAAAVEAAAAEDAATGGPRHGRVLEVGWTDYDGLAGGM